MNNGTTQYTASFHYRVFGHSRYADTCFFIVKNNAFVKFLYYIPNENKYKRKTERVDLYLKILHENSHTGFLKCIIYLYVTEDVPQS